MNIQQCVPLVVAICIIFVGCGQQKLVQDTSESIDTDDTTSTTLTEYIRETGYDYKIVSPQPHGIVRSPFTATIQARNEWLITEESSSLQLQITDNTNTVLSTMPLQRPTETNNKKHIALTTEEITLPIQEYEGAQLILQHVTPSGITELIRYPIRLAQSTEYQNNAARITQTFPTIENELATATVTYENAHTINWPSHIHPGQIDALISMENISLVSYRTLNPSVYYNNALEFLDSGMLYSLPDSNEYNDFLSIIHTKNTSVGNPNLKNAWVEDNQLYILTSNDYGAGSGEGTATVYSSTNGTEWVLERCFYYAPDAMPWYEQDTPIIHLADIDTAIEQSSTYRTFPIDDAITYPECHSTKISQPLNT